MEYSRGSTKTLMDRRSATSATTQRIGVHVFAQAEACGNSPASTPTSSFSTSCSSAPSTKSSHTRCRACAVLDSADIADVDLPGFEPLDSVDGRWAPTPKAFPFAAHSSKIPPAHSSSDRRPLGKVAITAARDTLAR